MQRFSVNPLFIALLFITVSILFISSESQASYNKKYENNRGWKAGEGKAHNGEEPVYKGKIPDNSNSVTGGCFVTFLAIPLGILILYIIFDFLRNSRKSIL